MGLSAAQKSLVKSQWGVIEKNRHANGKVMFRKVFEDPDTKALWKFTATCSGDPVENPEMTKHIDRIFSRITQVVSEIDDEGKMCATLKSTGSTHTGYGIQKKMYPVVGGGLICMLKNALGADFSVDAEDTWKIVWGVMTDNMFS